jgi:hypothetical protein
MIDLVMRLRTSAGLDDVHDAADLIETQAARIAELEAILRQLLDAQSPTIEVLKIIARAKLEGKGNA